MLSFDQKLSIISTYPQLERKDVSLGRVNFQFEGSLHDKKNVVYHLHPNGNGFVYVGKISQFHADEKGLLNIRDCSEEELRIAIEASIHLLSEPLPEQPSGKSKKRSGVWMNEMQQALTVTFEDELWYIYAGINLEAAFETFEEAEQYLMEEGFSPK